MLRRNSNSGKGMKERCSIKWGSQRTQYSSRPKVRNRTFQAEPIGSVKALWQGASWEKPQGSQRALLELSEQGGWIESKIGGASSCGVFVGCSRTLDCFLNVMKSYLEF